MVYRVVGHGVKGIFEDVPKHVLILCLSARMLPLRCSLEYAGLTVGYEVTVESHGAAREVGVYCGTGLIGSSCQGEVYGSRYGAALYVETVVNIAVLV